MFLVLGILFRVIGAAWSVLIVKIEDIFLVVWLYFS